MATATSTEGAGTATDNKPPSGGKIFSEQDRAAMMVDEDEESDVVADMVLTQRPNDEYNMELAVLAAASEAEARIAEEKQRVEIERKQMKREDDEKLATPKKRKSEKEEESKRKSKKPKTEKNQPKAEEPESGAEEEPDYVERSRQIAVELKAAKKKEQKRKERESKDRGENSEEEEAPKKPKVKKPSKPIGVEKQSVKSPKKKNKPQAAALTQASDEDSGDESPPQTPPPKKSPKKAPPAPKKEVKKPKQPKIVPPRPVDESSDDEDEKKEVKTNADGYAVSDEPYRFGVSKMDKIQAGVGRRDSDLVLTFFHSSVKGKFSSDNLQVPFGTHPSETMILFPSSRMKMGQQITFGCKGQERHNWKEFYDAIAEEVKPVGRLKIYDDGSLFRIRAQIARECQVFYAEDADDLNTQDNLAPSDITGNYVHHAICGRMSLLKLGMQETTTIEDGTVTWIYPTWIITHLLIINKVIELPPLKARPLSAAKPRGRQGQLKTAANGTPSLKSFYPVTWQ